MDKSEYLRLLSEASINDSSKFRAVPLERPSSKGRPPTYYRPLLQKEKELESIVHRILPKSIADTIRPTGSRLAHLYGLPKTHKDRLAMRPIQAISNANIQLRYWQTRTHCCGHIVAHDVSHVAQTGKHSLRTQNVSDQNQKHFLCPGHKICVRNKCCVRRQTGKHLCRQQCVRNNVTSFASTFTLDKMARH